MRLSIVVKLTVFVGFLVVLTAGTLGWACYENARALMLKTQHPEAIEAADDLRHITIGLSFRILIAALAFSYLLAMRFTRPIVELAACVRAVPLGRRVVRLPVAAHDEVGVLVTAFNELSAELAKSYETLEARVRDRTQELARSNAELEQFAYVASHDLQEPLRMVASYTQLLKRRYEGKLDADADEFIGFAVDGAQRMQGLIQDLLAYSRVGRQEIQRAEVEVGPVVESALSNLRKAIQEANALVIVRELPTVNTDPRQLVQLFQNLIGNGVKYRRPGVRPVVRIDATATLTEWVFSVEDNGIGIDPKFAQRVFVIFQRLHGRGEYPGSGIGLAICKKIVERHGGRIWVEAAPAGGSIFRFTLPRSI